jgi:hypothetical protein
VLAGVEAKICELSHPALTVQPRLGAPSHVRRFFQIVGMCLPNNYLVHNSSLNNLARGVLTRVLLVKGKPTPRPRAGIFSERLSYFRNVLLKKFSKTTPVTRQEFVGFYSGRRRTIYQNAVDSLLHTGIRSKDASIKAFVKAEFINCDDKPDPDPRVISPREPRYNVEVGRYLRPIEHDVYQRVADIFGEPTILKGYNAEQTGRIFVEKWNKYRDPVAVGLDASRFDQHVSSQALEWEHSIYNGIFRSEELAKLLRWQLLNRVTGHCRDGKLKYQVEGCRMSGDMNTAMGNCLIMCALVHAYLRSRGVQGSLANNGDDCMVIFERRDLSRFQDGLSDWFLEMGFNMVVEKPVYIIEQIEFCQTHPVFVTGKCIMVRNFPKALSKDCLSLKTLDSPIVCKSWMDAVGQGGLSLTGGIPVCQEFYSSFIRLASGICLPKQSRRSSKRRHRIPDAEISGGMAWLSKGMTRRYQRIAPETRHSFYLAFGVTPDMQIEIENFFRKQMWHNRLVEIDELIHLPKWI